MLLVDRDGLEPPARRFQDNPQSYGSSKLLVAEGRIELPLTAYETAVLPVELLCELQFASMNFPMTVLAKADAFTQFINYPLR